MATCLNSFRLPGEPAPIPCGKCPACLARRVSHWSFRLQQQLKVSTSAHFVTLTYENIHIRRSPNNYKTLSKKDVQLFIKKLRKRSPNTPPIKYYCCGEYGGQTLRPHYHLILFNAEPSNVVKAWGLGITHFGTVTAASVGYCLKYINKKNTKIHLHKNDDRLPEFSLQSTKLGANYLTLNMVKWHLADPNNRMYVNTADGKKISMPRYYKNKIYNIQQLGNYAEYIQNLQHLKEAAYDDNKIVNYLQQKKTALLGATKRHNYKIKQTSNNKI